MNLLTNILQKRTNFKKKTELEKGGPFHFDYKDW